MSVQSVRPVRPAPATGSSRSGGRPGRRVHTLLTLGDSTVVGLGDPLPGGGWRGFPVLLRDALGGPGAVRLVNPSRTGARMADVRREQLPAALAAARPDATVVCAGMNDALRSDFDPVGVRADLAAVLRTLAGAGSRTVVMRYHDHTRVFRLPGRLRSALRDRVTALNDAIDGAVADAREDAEPAPGSDSGRPGRTPGSDGGRRLGGGPGRAPGPGGADAGVADRPPELGAAGRTAVEAPPAVLDLHLLPGGYDRAAWSVDRLHPSELGHRLLARGAGDLLGHAGFAVPYPVALECAGGRVVTGLDRAVWLAVKGTPWLVRRGRDLGPVIVRGLLTRPVP